MADIRYQPTTKNVKHSQNRGVKRSFIPRYEIDCVKTPGVLVKTQ